MPAATIHALMPKVMESIGAISKASENRAQGFKFRGIDDVMNALNPALVKHGVFYLPEVLDSSYERYQTKNGTGMRSATLKVAFHFYGPAGDSVTAVGMGEAADSGDKATSKALAMALKYALLQTFCVPTEEQRDEDPDRHVVEGAAPKAETKPAPKATEPDDWGVPAVQESLGAAPANPIEALIAQGNAKGLILARARKVAEANNIEPPRSYQDVLDADADFQALVVKAVAA